jgi:hypothetical protein
MLDDFRFENGKHWSAADKDTRDTEDRPALVVPRCNQFLNQVKNEQRQAKPGIKVSPGDGPPGIPEKKRIKQAEWRQGIIRRIQYESCAVDAYQQAFDHAVISGRGFIHVLTEYASNSSNKQKIVIKGVKNPLDVYPGRLRNTLDYSDMTYCHILDKVAKTRFKKQYPDADESNFDETHTSGWISDKDITIADFYCIWTIKDELWTLEGGREIKKSQAKQNGIDETMIATHPQSNKPWRREIRDPYIMWYKMTATEILDRRHIPGSHIPVIPVIGKEQDIGGELTIEGLLRKLEDIQLMYDYAASAEAEELQLRLKNKYIMAVGQEKGLEKWWGNANKLSLPYLLYNPIAVGNVLAPPPQRQQPNPIDPSILAAKQSYVDDMKAITGQYDPSLGVQSNEVSGKAIVARQVQSDNANFNYPDNLRISLTHAGKIINEWLPEYYKGAQEVKMMDAEDNESVLRLGEYVNGEMAELGGGDFEVVVTMGQSHSTKRQQSVEFMMELIRAVPQVTPLIYDILVKNIDAPGAQQIAERLKKTIPPQLLEQEGGEQQMAMKLQQAMGELQKSQQIIQAMSQQLQQIMQELETKQIESATKIRVAEINKEARVAGETIRALEDDNKAALQFSRDMYKTWFNMQRQPTQTGVQS